MGLLSFADDVAKLIKQGFPESVAKRIASGELPMDQASRMQRAAEQGYTKAFHATPADFNEFIPSERGKLGPGVYSATNPSYTEKYIGGPDYKFVDEGSNIMPLAVRGKHADIGEWDAARKAAEDKAGRFLWSGSDKELIRDELMKRGFDGISIGDENVTFNPNNIRSALSAAFDPEYTGSNILGSLAGAGLLGAGLLGSDDAEAGPSSIIRAAVKAADDVSYRGSHAAPDEDYSAPFHDLTQMIPDDVYSSRGSKLYGFGDPEVDRQTFEALNYARGNPDAMVSVYRAVPKNVEELYSGDWVTPSRKYADLHGESALNDEYNIIQSNVPARALLSEGYPYELGISPNFQSGAANVGLLGGMGAMGAGAALTPGLLGEYGDYGSIQAEEYPTLQRIGEGIEAGINALPPGYRDIVPGLGLAEYLKNFGRERSTGQKALDSIWAALDFF